MTIPKHEACFYSLLLIIVLAISGCQTDNTFSCLYTPKQSSSVLYPELSQYPDCASINKQDRITITPQHLSNIDFDEYGLAAIHVNNAYHYVHRSGKVVRTHHFDNGADYFESGLARTTEDGKFGYIDRQLTVVIKPAFDFAFPFSGEYAVVCNGCNSVSDGEHKKVVGGKWGYINKTGQVVIPLKYSRDKLPAPPR